MSNHSISEDKISKTEQFWLCPSTNCTDKISTAKEINSIIFRKIAKDLYEHIRNGIKVICPIKLCGISYINYKTFNSHMNWHSRKHEFDVQVEETHTGFKNDSSVTNDLNKSEVTSELLATEIDIDRQNHSLKSPVPCQKAPCSEDAKLSQKTSILDIEKLEGMFALKLMAKPSLPQKVINDILSFSGNIHAAKLELIQSSLKK